MGNCRHCHRRGLASLCRDIWCHSGKLPPRSLVEAHIDNESIPLQLLNRQKRAKKTPIPLTNDMLNELKVNHMGGADNYGVDDFYNIDDPWNDTKQPIKPKVSRVSL